MYSRYEWGWGDSDVGPAIGRSWDVNSHAAMETVSVRRGGSCDPIMIPLENGKKVKVTGPPGCGKSSTFVSMVAIESRRPVVHLVPHPRLVEDFVRRGYGRCAVYTDLSHILDTPCVLKCPAVVVTTYTRFLAETQRIGRPIADVTRRPIYYCDECHESDAATFALVRIFMSRDDTHTAVFVSATLDGEEAVIESNDPIVDVVVPRVTRSAEFAKVVGDNLATRDDRGLVLIYCDSGLYNMDTVQEMVESKGYLWFRLNSRSSRSEYEAARFAAKSEKAVFCLDSSYRSGFDFPVTMVIDCGSVTYRSSRNPAKVVYRDAFGFELYQARGRLGRDPKMSEVGLKYVRVNTDPKDHLVNIEGYEGVLAAHLFRAQGLPNPRELRGTGLDGQDGYLPDYRLIDSDTFLTASMLKSLVDIERGRKAKALAAESDESEYGDPLLGFAALNIGKAVPSVVPNAIGKTMLSVAGAVEDTSAGTQTFPLGKDSVLQCLDGPGLTSVLPHMSRRDIFLVSGVLAEVMNNMSCEYLAADALVKFVAKEPEGSRSSSQVKWLREFHSALGIKSSQFMSRARDLQVLVDNSSVDFAILDPREFKDVITTMASACISVYKSQKSSWLPNDTIVGSSRNHMLSNYSINTGFDARGNSIKAADPVRNDARLDKQTSGAVQGWSRGRPYPDYSVKEIKLGPLHASRETMQKAYPNAVLIDTPARIEYEERRRRSEAGESSSRGSWSESHVKGKGIFKIGAKTWHPPG